MSTQPPGPQGPGQGGYEQQPWKQQPASGSGGWRPDQPLPTGGGWQPHQQQGQSQWQPPPGGGGKKTPLIIAGAVAGVLVIGLVVFLGIKAFSGDDPVADPTPSRSTEPTSDPSSVPTPTSGTSSDPTSGPTSTNSSGPPAKLQTGLGRSTGQAKAATSKLQAAGFQCGDLFNDARGGHRGCFRYNKSTEAEALFQFRADGKVIGMSLRSYDSDNVLRAKQAFDQTLDALGSQVLGASLAKVKAAVNTGDKRTEVGTDWGELRISNSGDTFRITGGMAGADSFELPRKQFDSTEQDVRDALKAKGYDCDSYCKKGGYGRGEASTFVSVYGSSGEGVRTVSVRVSGEGPAVSSAFTTTATDVLGALRGVDVNALQTWFKSVPATGSTSAYVNGWRVDIKRTTSSTYPRYELELKYETFYV